MCAADIAELMLQAAQSLFGFAPGQDFANMKRDAVNALADADCWVTCQCQQRWLLIQQALEAMQLQQTSDPTLDMHNWAAVSAAAPHCIAVFSSITGGGHCMCVALSSFTSHMICLSSQPCPFKQSCATAPATSEQLHLS